MNVAPDPEPALPVAPKLAMAPGESVDEAVRRMALEQLETMGHAFGPASGDLDLDRKVHSARKAGKRLRSLFRLARPTLGEAMFRRSNLLVRDQSRRLSDLRSATVILSTLDDLTATGSLDPEALAPLRAALADHRAALVRRFERDRTGATAAREALVDLATRVSEFQYPAESKTSDLAPLRPSIRTTYRRARRAMRRAEEARSAEALHEWRKQVNHLRYQLEAVSGVCGPETAAMSGALDELSEQLGSANDMADLRMACEGQPGIPPAAAIALVTRRMNDHAAAALEAGHRLFSPSPKSFVRQLATDCASP